MNISNSIKYLTSFVMLLTLGASTLWCQESQPIRPVTSAYMLECGQAFLADTYLTPLKYKGIHLALNYERAQAMKFNPAHWSQHLMVRLSGDITKNPAKNATMGSGLMNISWGMTHRWHLPKSIVAAIGPEISIEGGCLYLDRNGNNPCSARGAITVGALGYVSWSHQWWKIPFTLRYQAQLPVTGAFFSPEYAQLYYQIYLGDREGLAHAAWWGNYFRLDNLCTADLHFGSTTLRLGYRCNITSTKANHLVTRDISHAFVLGVVCDWISLRHGYRPANKRIINYND